MDLQAMKSRQANINEHREMLVQDLGIFELRALGRELGVKSPTTKKRDELIELIIGKIYNNDGTNLQPQRKGRPYKKLTNLDEIIAKVATGNKADNNIIHSSLRYEDIVSFAQDVPIYSKVVEKVGEFAGVVRTNDVVAYFVDIKTGKQVFISKEDMAKYKLSDGDYVECSAKIINSSEQYQLCDLQSINLAEARKHKAVKTNESNPIISYETLPFGDAKLYCGRRSLILYPGNLFEDERFKILADYLAKNDITLITLALNTSFEDQIMFSQVPSMINMTTVYGSRSDTGFDKVVDAIAFTERCLARGKKCVLFVGDVVSLLNTLDTCFDDEKIVSGHKASSIVILQKLVSLGKALSDGSSATIAMTYRENDKTDPYLVGELERICSKVN